MNEIQKLESWRRDLAIAETFEEIKLHDSAAAAAADFARRERLSLEKQNEIGRFRIEIESKKGRWLEDNFPAGGTGANQYRSAEVSNINLCKMPATKHESTRARTIAETEPEKVEKIMAEIESKGEVITPNAVSKVLKVEEKKQKFEQSKAVFYSDTIKEGKTVYEVFEGDCNEYMRQTPERFDLILTDPPYAMDFKSGWSDRDKIQGDKRSETQPLLNETFKNIQSVMNDDAQIYVFGNPYELDWLKPLFCQYFNLKNILVWDRGVIGMGDLSTYGRSFDIILFGYYKNWRGLNGIRERDVLQFDRVSPGQLEHPTQKPASILEYIIKKSSKEGQNVFDPFAGSCSTLKAAQSLNRNAYGCEIETKYIKK